MSENPALEEARRLYYRATAYLCKNQNAEAVHFFEQSLDIYPELFGARIGLAISCGRLSRFDQALEVCREGLSNWAESDYHRFHLYLTMGDIFTLQGDYPKAESAFYHALKYASKKSLPLSRNGLILCKRGSFKEAFEFFLKAAQSE